MLNILIFGGTTEGRRLAEFCEGLGIEAHVSVAGAYGREMLAGLKQIRVLEGRMDAEEMLSFIQKHKIEAVYDATHPYAVSVSENIRIACARAGVSLVRVRRELGGRVDAKDVRLEFPDIERAVEYLCGTEGNILITTGSKEIEKYKSLGKKRLYARILPSKEALDACEAAGIEASHIIAMQGPFSEEMNAALIRGLNCKYLVSKQSGSRGGFEEKMRACEETGCIPLLIGIPRQDEGVKEVEAKADIRRRHEAASLLSPERGKKGGEGAKPPRKAEEEERGAKPLREDSIRIGIAGIGPGGRKHMSAAAAEAILNADAVCGGRRMLDAALRLRREEKREPPAEVFAEYRAEQIVEWMEQRAEEFWCKEEGKTLRILVLMSGDSGFFSGTQRLCEKLFEASQNRESPLRGIRPEIIPGISSLSYMAARLGMAWQDMKILSLHGREEDLLPALERSRRLFIITSGGEGVGRIIERLSENGYGEIEVCIGENLSYPNERILCGKAKEFLGERFGELVSMILVNENPGGAIREEALPYRLGIPDKEFIRGSVPMTKAEVRAVSLSKLRLREDAICYDIGAGTGSVAIEMALLAGKGRVYAIEHKEEALFLIGENSRRFGAKNIEIIGREASEAIPSLPPPSHVFIGGSGGRLEEIVDMLYEKNHGLHLVINAVSIESVAKISGLLERYEERGYQTELLLLCVSGTRKMGGYRMPEAKNPVFIAAIHPSECEREGER